jgi:antitoxin component YwqK of YwqJK toxin-antitoxin module
LNGKRHGFGVDYWPNNAIKYTGEYKVDERCGYGTEFDKFRFKVTEGNCYDGEFLG